MEIETPEGKVTISRKILYGIVVLVIVVLAGVMIYFFGSSSTSNVKIVTFYYDTRPYRSHQSGEQMIFAFYVKIENSGSNNVSDLVLEVKVLVDHSELGRDTSHIETLQAGRRRTMSMVVRVNMSELSGKITSFVATLYLDNTIVDEVRY